jgi:DEAD/DEAH box helicase domain-containing protein
MDSTPPHAVGFDIETTGVGSDDIITVACAWSPETQVSCFYGDDFAPLLLLLDNAEHIYTFNGIEFDLPRLAKHCGRCMGPWARKAVDPLYAMKVSMGFGACDKLNNVLMANGFDPKIANGLQAIQFWKERNLTALEEYCMDDARLTYELCETKQIVWGKWNLDLRQPWMLRVRM